MSPIKWAVRPLKHYANFSGRSPRAEYWWFVLLQLMLVWLPLTVLAISSSGASAGVEEAAGPALASGFLLIGLAFLALLIPNLAVQVRRLHDQDKSGWFLLLFFIPYIGGLVALVFMCIAGTKGSNRYGPDPYAKDNLHNVFA